MKVNEQISQAVDKLLGICAYDEITFSDIAKEAGCHWTTVKRYFGDKSKMRDVLFEKQSEKECQMPDIRTKILDAGSKMFSQNGYDGTSLEQIANTIGLSKGAVYWHFSSKSELYLSICENSLKRLHNNVAEKLYFVLSSEDQVNAIKNLLQAELSSCEANCGELPRLFLQFVSTNNDMAIKEKLNRAFSELFSGTADSLLKIQKMNLIGREINTHALAVGLHAMMNGLVLMWLISPSAVAFDEVSSTIAEMLWYGINPKNES